MSIQGTKAFQRSLAAVLAAVLLLSSGLAGATGYDTLEYGSRGAEVLQLQIALATLGYDPNGADGKFGKGTEKAVKRYQEAKRLTADGKAGNRTLTALYADLASVGGSANSAGTTGSTETGGSATTSGSTSSSTNPNTLKYGDSGSRVTELQTALKALGYGNGGVDGRFGAGTQLAVTNFQKANGLTADGLAGTQTQNLLYSLAASAGASSGSGTSSGGSGNASSGTTTGGSSGSTGYTRTLRKGDTGSDVSTVQTRLKELGYYTGSIDGVYGSGSIAAVKLFQQRNGLTADGLAGSRTFTALYSAAAVAAGSSSGSASGESSGNGSGSSSSDTSGNSSGSSSVYLSLSYGATGDSVKKLQNALKALNYNVTADGDYGALTQTAVAAFQKRNGLTSDGVAGARTQELLYSGSALAADPSANADMVITGDTGKASGPSTSSVQLLHWYNDVKPSIRSGQKITIFDPATSLQWTLRLYSLGRHADSEPLTLTDTQIMYKAFGNTNTWTPKAVYVQLPSGVWTVASMHNVPHLSGSISDNGFDGHLCVHFLRDMDECTRNDPNYGVNNQNVIRNKWKQMTGITVE